MILMQSTAVILNEYSKCKDGGWTLADLHGASQRRTQFVPHKQPEDGSVEGAALVGLRPLVRFTCLFLVPKTLYVDLITAFCGWTTVLFLLRQCL